MIQQECTSSHHALVRAVCSGRPRQVGLLLEAGASHDVKDECGKTPLIHSIFIDDPKHRRKIVKMLLKKGASVSASDASGRTALSWACLQGKDREVDLLLQYSDANMDLNHHDINGRTALFNAATSGSAASVKLMVDALIECGMSVDVTDFNGVTPLMQTLSLGFDVCATILLKQGKATPTVPDSTFMSAFDWARPSRGSSKQSLPALTETRHSSTPRRSESGLCRMCSRISSMGEAEFDSCYGSESSWTADDMMELGGRSSQSFSDDEIFDLASLSLADFSPSPKRRRPSSQDSGSEILHEDCLLPPLNKRTSAVRRPKTHIRRNTVSGRLGDIRESIDCDEVFIDDDEYPSALSDQSEMRRQHGFPLVSEGRFSLASRADGSTRTLTALRAQIDKLL